jgi:hypothetical protein
MVRQCTTAVAAVCSVSSVLAKVGRNVYPDMQLDYAVGLLLQAAVCPCPSTGTMLTRTGGIARISAYQQCPCTGVQRP